MRGYFFRQARQNLIQNPWLNAITLGTITLSFLILGLFLIVFINAKGLLDEWGGRIRVTAYLGGSPGQEQMRRLGEKVAGLMVVWEDIPSLNDRSLQQVLRGVNERQLALALQGASAEIAGKIKSSISERAGAMVDEEIALMSAPKKEDIRQARDAIVVALQELNQKGELTFAEEQSNA